VQAAVRGVLSFHNRFFQRKLKLRLAMHTFEKPFDRITVDPGMMGGKPCIRGMRISVLDVLRIVSTFKERERLFFNYPDLEEEDIKQALAFAGASLDCQIIPLKVA
jgi:uncharacterized protein (DUF433 family)